MRAVIHGGRELELQAEAGYIDARPLTAYAQVVEIFLHRTAGPYIRIKTGGQGQRRSHFAELLLCAVTLRSKLPFSGEVR
jgi:hypothetical protein